MNNLSSYCGLVDAKIRASDKDLPVEFKLPQLFNGLSTIRAVGSNKAYTADQGIPIVTLYSYLGSIHRQI